MKCKIPEISWHNRDPVLSVDIQPMKQSNASAAACGTTTNNKHRLASGGTDAHVLIWYMNYTEDGNDIELDLAADLTRHQRAVNAVKWSPNGELLASGDDESVVFIWKQKGDQEPLNILDNTNEQDKEVWIVLKVLRGHMEDIYDLSWAPNSQFLVTGSVDNTAMIWDVHKGKSTGMLRDHKSFVQGVAWDPKNQYIATLSSDRYLRIFDLQTKRVLHRINKSSLPVGNGHQLYGQRLRLFHDDTLQTFFRRLCFTPDGKLLLTPAGVAEADDVAHHLHTTYVFSRHAFRQPAIVLPSPGQYTVAVRCCPILYRLRPHKPDINPPVVPLPYRMIFAVATRSSVYFYDTQQRQPFAVISNIHYTRLTDVTWSSDGRIVVVSSTDGFCSLITFEAGELGEEYENAAEVLSSNDTNSVTKKTKKQKENDGGGGGLSTKERKLSTDEPKDVSAMKRDPLSEIVEEQKPEEEAKAVIGEKDKQQQQAAIGDTESMIVKGETTPVKNDKNKIADNARQPSAANTVATALTISKTLGASIIIDKEILSSDERFESPEKKSNPATPIMVRRTPRAAATLPNTIQTSNTPKTIGTSSETPKSHATTTQVPVKTPISNAKCNSANSATRPSKAPTPIQVRRTPRAIIVTPDLTATATTAAEEIALDAWPTPMEVDDEEMGGQPKTVSTSKDISEKQPDTAVTDIPKPIEINLECTEDIRLVYEDSQDSSTTTTPSKASGVELTSNRCEEKFSLTAAPSPTPSTSAAAAKTPTQKTPLANSKTPRRVALKTISTPKSKKKLLD